MTLDKNKMAILCLLQQVSGAVHLDVFVSEHENQLGFNRCIPSITYYHFPFLIIFLLICMCVCELNFNEKFLMIQCHLITLDVIFLSIMC